MLRIQTCLWWERVFNAKNTDLSLVGARLPVQMQKSVTIGAQIPAIAAQNDGGGLPVIMVITRGLCNTHTTHARQSMHVSDGNQPQHS